MSELSEQEQRKFAKLSRQLENMEKRDQRRKERKATADHLRDLFRTWADETDCSEHTFNRVKKEVGRLIDEVHQGKIENVEERFQRAVEQAVATTLPKKRITYLKLSHALQELVGLNTAWTQTARRSKAEQDQMLRKLRILLLEIEAGQTEDIAERFHQAAASLSTTLLPPEGESEQEREEQ